MAEKTAQRVSPSTDKRLISLFYDGPTDELIGLARRTQLTFCKDKVYLRGLLEFSNYCLRNCLYCGLRRENTRLTRYRMTEEAILKAAESIAASGIWTVVLQSGDDPYYTKDKLCRIIEKIKESHPGMAVTLSAGERPLRDYSAFRKAGADRYLIKHETANPRLYKRLHPGQTLKRRLEITDFLRSLGYQIGLGNIIGLPGQTKGDLLADLFFLRRAKPDMIGIGPFLPQKDTPLGGLRAPGEEIVLRFLALARIVTGYAHIPATTAVGSMKGDRMTARALCAGCNVIMVNFTPTRLTRDYRIYDYRKTRDVASAVSVIKRASLIPSGERGDSLRPS